MTTPLDLNTPSIPILPVDGLNKKASLAKDDEALKEACAGFESIFLKKIMEGMRDTLQGDVLFGKSNAMGIYESMYDQHLSEELSKSERATGLKDFLYRELKSRNLNML